jgi:hypothetical protein
MIPLPNLKSEVAMRAGRSACLAVPGSVAVGLVLLLAVVGLSGCERKARTDKPKHYDRQGVSFNYPGNWKIAEDSSELGIRSIEIETPGDAILIIQVYPAPLDDDLRTQAATFAEAMREEGTGLVSIGPSKSGTVKKWRGYERLSEKFTISAAGEAVVHKRAFLRKKVGDKQLFCIAQVASEDSHLVQPGFEQVLGSIRITGKK